MRTSQQRSPPEVLAGPLSLVIERGAGLFEAWRAAPCPALILPLGTCVVEIVVSGLPRGSLVDRAATALVPAGMRYRLRSASALVEVLTLWIGEQAQAEARTTYAPYILEERLQELVARARLLPRTRWVDELAQRYLFERDVCFKHDSAAARFLETELTKELYFLGAEHDSGGARTTGVFQGSEPLARARRWIEDRLYQRISLAELAAVAHMSAATLQRMFLRELGVTPSSYQRGRRLEEAVLLLRAGRLTVGEVAERVGYASLSAFTSAFRRHFGVPPSSVGAAIIDGAFVPAHGAPLRSTLPPGAATSVRRSRKQMTVSRNARPRRER